MEIPGLLMIDASRMRLICVDSTATGITWYYFAMAYPKAGKFVNLHFPWIYIFARIYIPNLRKLKGKCKFYIFPKNVVFR